MVLPNTRSLSQMRVVIRPSSPRYGLLIKDKSPKKNGTFVRKLTVKDKSPKKNSRFVRNSNKALKRLLEPEDDF